MTIELFWKDHRLGDDIREDIDQITIAEEYIIIKKGNDYSRIKKEFIKALRIKK